MGAAGKVQTIYHPERETPDAKKAGQIVTIISGEVPRVFGRYRGKVGWTRMNGQADYARGPIKTVELLEHLRCLGAVLALVTGEVLHEHCALVL